MVFVPLGPGTSIQSVKISFSIFVCGPFGPFFLIIAMLYRYTHIETRGATGYYACVPEGEPGLQEALALLACRPLDSFLARYCQRLFAHLPEEERESIRAKYSPLKTLSDFWAKMEERPHRIYEIEKFRANLAEHTSLPAAPALTTELEAQIRLIGARRGILASKFALAEREPDFPQDLKVLYRRVDGLLKSLGISAEGERRHEASLSPIALLRDWNLSCGIDTGVNPHRLVGVATAYGRGLSLAGAKVSCVMEIVERASAYAAVQGQSANGWPLIHASSKELERNGINHLGPVQDARLYWREGESAAGRRVYVPAQRIYLFFNHSEPEICEGADSTGLGAGETVEQAKLAALLELIERYSHASTPFLRQQAFQLTSHNPALQSLFADYRAQGIFVQFQEITSEIGVPVYRCFVESRDGGVAQACAAHLSGSRAALAALTETPWPYHYETGMPSPSAFPAASLPVRYLDDLPDYDSGSSRVNLDLLESSLLAMGLDPVYVDLTRPDLGLPVYRAFIPGLETDCEFEKEAGTAYAARLAILRKEME